MILIDGKKVSDDQVDPEKHRFIGMFREPFNMQRFDGPFLVMCPCGASLDSFVDCMQHWQMGHWDIPQYVII